VTDFTELWTAAEAAASDRYSMDDLGTPSPVLMERAALCVSTEVESVFRSTGRPVLILCGPGNNGGDGLAAARQLHCRGIDVTAVLVTAKRNAAAQEQLDLARSHCVAVRDELPEQGGAWVLVDALLGTGSTGAPRGRIADVLAWCAGSPGGRVAVDLPSGVDPDTGAVFEGAFRADVTVTFARSMVGLHVTPGRDHAGRVVIGDIGLLAAPGAEARARLIAPEWVKSRLNGLPAGVHKGERGHLGIVGGSAGTPGAVVLAGAAALRTGAGLVTIGSRDPEVQAQLLAHRPELMVVLREEETPLPQAEALVVGPGLTSESERDGLENLYRSDERPAIWDASSLDSIPVETDPAGPRVITPHPGEAARMLSRATGDKWSSGRVQATRVIAARTLAEKTRSVTVLKGGGTVVARPDGSIAVCVTGGSELATAGSGDCLAGVIGALLVRGLDAWEAACVGVHVHGLAGDIAGAAGAGVIAMDVADATGPAMQGRGDIPRWPTLRRG
jgi:NAD(P)H-hydrate epimerase